MVVLARLDISKLRPYPSSDRLQPQALQVLLSRSSVAPKTLVAPGPTAEEIRLLIACALMAPDHAALRPWRFIAIEGGGRQQLSNAFVEIRRRRNPGIRPLELAMTWKKTMRAPTLIGVVARLNEGHPKVPLHEQYVSLGAAIHGLMLGAHALGYGAIILSGNRARAPMIHALFGLGVHEQMVGFVSIGTPSKRIMPKTRPQPADYLEIWRGGEDSLVGSGHLSKNGYSGAKAE
jgi:nitroreductase